MISPLKGVSVQPMLARNSQAGVHYQQCAILQAYMIQYLYASRLTQIALYKNSSERSFLKNSILSVISPLKGVSVQPMLARNSQAGVHDQQCAILQAYMIQYLYASRLTQIALYKNSSERSFLKNSILSVISPLKGVSVQPMLARNSQAGVHDQQCAILQAYMIQYLYASRLT